MQDRYTGDVGDFGKYGLLRALRLGPRRSFRLGVVWYLVIGPENNGDGRHLSYLSDKHRSSYEPCDWDLFGALSAVIKAGVRSVHCIEQGGLLGADTVFFQEPLTWHRGQVILREQTRRDWLDRALRTTQACDLVFLDPDNGLARGDWPASRRRLLGVSGPKYVGLSEVKAFFAQGHSVVLYHHLNRLRRHRDQAEELIVGLRGEVSPDAFGFWFRRGSGRVFAVLPTVEHAPALRERAKGFASGPWVAHGHFRPIGL